MFNVVEHYEMTIIFVSYVWNLTTEGFLEGNDWFTFIRVNYLLSKNWSEKIRSIQNLN